VYGIFASIWAFFIFLHRTAPTPELSGLFFKIGMFFHQIYIVPLLLVTVLCIRNFKKSYVLYIIPAVIVGVFVFILPVEILESEWGWSYKFLPGFMHIFTASLALYSIITCFILVNFIKNSIYIFLRKKYKIILYGLLLYTVGMPLTNYIISTNPDFPPFGGVLTIIFFLLVAYAINLPTEKITLSPILKIPLEEISNSYLQFLNAFQNRIPGKELGESSFRFEEYVDGMGLKDVVIPKFGKLIFDADKLSDENISEAPDNILKIIKEYRWALETVNDFTGIFLKTYEIMQLMSRKRADKWLEQMLHAHGGFLYQQGILDAMPKEIELPPVFKELQPGKVYLFKEDTPKEAYSELKEALNWGFECLCVTKLHPQKIRERYGMGKASVIWLTFKESNAEKAINPKRLDELSKAISKFVNTTSRSAILLDCFREIIMVNGFERATRFLKEVKEICKVNNSNMLISLNPEMFGEKELAVMEKEMEK